MGKLVYNWGRVEAGDVISFRYKKKLHSVLVLNPKIKNKTKDGKLSQHLVGLKLEERGNIPTIRNKGMLANILQEIGEIKIVSGDDYIYRVEISEMTSLGARASVYKKIKRQIRTYSIYRTYNYEEAKKSTVFLEPISLPKDLTESLIEKENKTPINWTGDVND